MADSSSNLSLPPDTVSARQIRSSLFHTSGSRVGAGVKNLPDSESAWSPTSPLDYRLFSNLSNVFSAKSSRPSFQTENKKPLDGSKVGLGIITSLVNETKPNNEILGKFPRKNIIFGSQVKNHILQFSKNNHESLAPFLKTNSLPKNYVISLPSETKSPTLPSKTKSPKSEVESFDDDVNRESKGLRSSVVSSPDSSRPSSLINSNQSSNLGTNDLFVEVTSTPLSLLPVTNTSSQVDDSLKIISSSLPVSIDFSNGYVGSLSAKEIELSEDYTCIISHGPNPKRTHIFGDCILECHNNDFTEFSKKEESAPHRFDSVMSFCYTCDKKFDEEGEDVHAYSDEKAFCSFKCRSEEILAEEEMEKTCTNTAKSSPNSSYHDDIFLMGLPVSK